MNVHSSLYNLCLIVFSLSKIFNKGDAYFGIDAVNITTSKYLETLFKNSFANGLTKTYILYITPSKSTSKMISFFSNGVKLE